MRPPFLSILQHRNLILLKKNEFTLDCSLIAAFAHIYNGIIMKDFNDNSPVIDYHYCFFLRIVKKQLKMTSHEGVNSVESTLRFSH